MSLGYIDKGKIVMNGADFLHLFCGSTERFTETTWNHFLAFIQFSWEADERWALYSMTSILFCLVSESRKFVK